MPQAKAVLATAHRLLERIHNLQDYGHLNVSWLHACIFLHSYMHACMQSEGFRKIVKKLDKRTGSQHSIAFASQVAVCSFSRAVEVHNSRR